MGKFAGVFLDFYGTVAAGDRRAVQAICQRIVDDHGLAERGIEVGTLMDEWGRRYFEAVECPDGMPFRTLFEIERDTLVQTLHPLLGRVEVRAYTDMFTQYLSKPPLFEEVREVLSRCPLPVCVVSNADERELRAAAEYHDLRFAGIISSEAARSYKPSPAIFQYALRRMAWSADRILHVGDSLHSDVAGAHAAGIKVAWVERAERILDIGTDQPDFIWTDLRPLLMLNGAESP